MTYQAAQEPILWTEAEPARLRRDLEEIARFAPELEYHPPASDGSPFPHGGWLGRLPVWPFERPEPDGLHDLIGQAGADVAVICSAAHPVVPPRVVPGDPEPTLHQQTQNAWHVAPDGSLCLLQSQGAWQPEASVTDLLAKAAGWRIEFALMQAGVIDRMSTRGIVMDASHDHLIAAAVDAAAPPKQDAGEES